MFMYRNRIISLLQWPKTQMQLWFLLIYRILNLTDMHHKAKKIHIINYDDMSKQRTKHDNERHSISLFVTESLHNYFVLNLKPNDNNKMPQYAIKENGMSA